MKKPKVHRGEVLKAVVKRSKIGIAEATKRSGYSRSSYYIHIADPDLPFDILEQYGKAIKYDFSYEFPEMPKYMSFTQEPDIAYYSLEQLRNEYGRLRERYYELLDKYHLLMEENHSLMEEKWRTSQDPKKQSRR